MAGKTIQYFIDFFKSNFNADKPVVENDPDIPDIVSNVVHNYDKSKVYSITHKDTEYVLGHFKKIKQPVNKHPRSGVNHPDGARYYSIYFRNINDGLEREIVFDDTLPYFDLNIQLLHENEYGQTVKHIYAIPEQTIFEETDAPKEEESEGEEQREPTASATCVGGTGCGVWGKGWWRSGKSAKKQKKRRSKRTKRNRKSRSNKRKIKN